MSQQQNGDVQLQDGSNVEAVNGHSNDHFSKDSLQNAPVKGDRVIKKAKRPSKHVAGRKSSESGDDDAVGLVNGNARLPFSKNSRKSRGSKGRGNPKKGGAGGKGTWGKPGDELVDEDVDENDPNYDSDTMTRSKSIEIKAVEVPLTDEQVLHTVEALLKEYMENGDLEDVLASLGELRLEKLRERIISLAVTLALEKHDNHREMTSQLISGLYGEVYTQAHVTKAFDDLLDNLNDLTLDTPDAPKVLGQFIARAVADDCLPPKYINSYKGSVEESHVRSALDKADILLSINHGIVRLDNVWGMAGPNRPVKALVKRVNLLLKEYLSSGDVTEATRCLKELDVPHFHHEFVYEAILMVLEDTTERSADQITGLLSSLYKTNLITPNQMDQGVRRIYNAMTEICIDVPAAYSLLEGLGEKMNKQHLLSAALLKDLPSRGRKRFVSEGDGGLIKPAATVY